VVEAHNLHAKYTEPQIVALVDKIFGPAGPATARPTDQELADWGKLVRVANLIEALGVIASEKAITPQVIYKMWGGAILSAWPAWDTAVHRLREYDREPDTFHHFEWISLEIKRISEDRKESRPQATSSVRRAPQAGAAAEPGTTSSALPPFGSGMPNRSASGLPGVVKFAAALVALLLFRRWLRRRSR
jgi:hypothetical protein